MKLGQNSVKLHSNNDNNGVNALEVLDHCSEYIFFEWHYTLYTCNLPLITSVEMSSSENNNKAWNAIENDIFSQIKCTI